MSESIVRRPDGILTFRIALAFFLGAVIADLLLIGGDLVVSVMSWRGHGR